MKDNDYMNWIAFVLMGIGTLFIVNGFIYMEPKPEGLFELRMLVGVIAWGFSAIIFKIK